MMKMRHSVIALLLALSCLLSACGAGGGGSQAASQSDSMTRAAVTEQAATKAAKRKGKPLFSGKFVSQADQVGPLEKYGKTAYQELQVGKATITLGRFETRHALDSHLDGYSGSDFEVNEEITLSGDIEGTHYRWRCGSKKKKYVMDAVVAEAKGYCILFLCQDPVDAFKGKDKQGPKKATVNKWVKTLTVKYQ